MVGGGDSGKPEEPKNPENPGNFSKKKTQEFKYTKSYRRDYGSQPFALNAKRTKGDGKLTFASSNAKIASVHRTPGKVTIKGPGRAVITVTAAETKTFKKSVSSKIVKNRKTISKTTPKLKKGKTYYVRVRAYKNIKVNGKTKKLYGSWSKAKRSGKMK